MPEKPKRKYLSKKVRFEVFKRDGFTCQYCGQTPPAIILEIDHIVPVSIGGTNDMDNLTTACFDCNRGKRDIPLNSIPVKLSKKINTEKEKEDQLKEYRKFLKRKNKRVNNDISDIDRIYQDHFKKWCFSESFKRVTIKKFLELLVKEDIEDSLYIAISKYPNDADRCLRYFCGVCWRKINGFAKTGNW